MRYLILFFVLCFLGGCATTAGGGLSYKAGAQKERLKNAIQSKNPQRIKEEATKAAALLEDLNRLQEQDTAALKACKEDLASANKYKFTFWGIIGALGLAGIIKLVLKYFL